MDFMETRSFGESCTAGIPSVTVMIRWTNEQLLPIGNDLANTNMKSRKANSKWTSSRGMDYYTR